MAYCYCICIIISCSAFIWARISFSLGMQESRLSCKNLPNATTTKQEPVKRTVSKANFADGLFKAAGILSLIALITGFSWTYGSAAFSAALPPLALPSSFLAVLFLL